METLNPSSIALLISIVVMYFVSLKLNTYYENRYKLIEKNFIEGIDIYYIEKKVKKSINKNNGWERTDSHFIKENIRIPYSNIKL